jgi:hypothetical protein
VHYDEDKEPAFRLCVLQDNVVLRIGDKLVWRVPAGQYVQLTLDRNTGVLNVDAGCRCEPEVAGVIPGEEAIEHRTLIPLTNSGGAASPS